MADCFAARQMRRKPVAKLEVPVQPNAADTVIARLDGVIIVTGIERVPGAAAIVTISGGRVTLAPNA